MSYTIHDYTKTGCTNCGPKTQYFYDLAENSYTNPSNRLVSSCKESEGFNCSNTQVYDVSIQPKLCTEKERFRLITKELSNLDYTLHHNYDNYVKRDDGKWDDFEDKRLYDAARGMQIQIDRLPADGMVTPDKVYDERLNNIKTGYYNSYEDINAGDMTYYVDASVSDPFYTPIFTQKSKITHSLYKSPMDTIEARYDRFPIVSNHRRSSYPHNDAFTSDTITHRENIMATQMAKKNKKKWVSRWHYECNK